ncbi:hypothetical protein QBC43DRAFT_287728 [Cladorrhinum sp. PSN259]|nr:hypothetical protein QBC43DRAFT_287728 [Cladorrhinum sp. PSN259]
MASQPPASSACSSSQASQPKTTATGWAIIQQPARGPRIVSSSWFSGNRRRPALHHHDQLSALTPSFMPTISSYIPQTYENFVGGIYPIMVYGLPPGPFMFYPQLPVEALQIPAEPSWFPEPYGPNTDDVAQPHEPCHPLRFLYPPPPLELLTGVWRAPKVARIKYVGEIEISELSTRAQSDFDFFVFPKIRDMIYESIQIQEIPPAEAERFVIVWGAQALLKTKDGKSEERPRNAVILDIEPRSDAHLFDKATRRILQRGVLECGNGPTRNGTDFERIIHACDIHYEVSSEVGMSEDTECSGSFRVARW